MSEPRAVRLRAHGFVQGVGFREGLRWAAGERGATGWVRNRTDGTVEAVVQGPAEAVDAVIAWARRGPRSARVERLDVAEEPLAGYDGFERRPSA